MQETPQTETTPFYPRSPYGAAKAYAILGFADACLLLAIVLLAVQPGDTSDGSALSQPVSEAVSYLLRILPGLCDGAARKARRA